MQQNTHPDSAKAQLPFTPGDEGGDSLLWVFKKQLSQMKELRHSLSALGDPDALLKEVSDGLLNDGGLQDCLHATATEEERVRNAFNLGRLYARNETADSLKKLETQLQEAQKLIALGRLAGGIAHDFNNLLTAIMGYARLAQCQINPEDEIYDDIDQVVHAGERAVELTTQLLNMARKQPVCVRPINVNTVIEETANLLRRTMGTDIEMVCLPGDKLEGVEIDAGQLQQVIMNFALNARDAMPEGGKLTITTHQEQVTDTLAEQLSLDAGTYVVITVSDTGHGMEPAVVEHMFDPFFTTKEVGKGAGLGLATANEIITKAGGTVRVRSGKGEGTEMRMYFPGRDSLCAEIIEDGQKMEIPRGSEAILIVEDDPSVLQFAEKALAYLGYHTYTATNGEEALRVFEEHDDIQLVLTDIIMPLMNGKKLIEHLSELGKPFKAMYMSGFCQEVFLQGPQELAMIPMLKKPYSQSKLGRAVRQILDADIHSLTCIG
ncbi:MAG: response regulator [Spartobacteria bacterium]|nr:response regulator [Spartobacteria bacterium]